MQQFMSFVIIGLATGATYAIAATGLVLTFTTSRVFNLAHGAIGMAQAFVYYQFRVAWHIPEIPSLLLTLFVVAPIMGILLSRLVMQRLARTTVAVRLMGTLAIFVLLQGIVLLIWGNTFRALPGLISDNTVSVFEVKISYNQLATVVIAIVVVIALRGFLRGTRTGIAMRAVVDNPQLAELTAISPARIQDLAWAIGSSLAGLSAILIAPSVSLDIGILSLLIVSAFAAAIVGGLANIGWTYAGGIGLGVAASLMMAYFPYNNQFLQDLPASLPFIVLFIALVLMRQERQALQKVRGLVADVPASPRSIVTWGLIFVAVMAALAPTMSSFVSFVIASGLVYGAILLSMVLLTGLAGQVSLCQFSFVGIGAITMIHLSHHMPYPVAALMATVFTGGVGAVIAFPALRLRSLRRAGHLRLRVDVRQTRVQQQHAPRVGRTGHSRPGTDDFRPEHEAGRLVCDWRCCPSGGLCCSDPVRPARRIRSRVDRTAGLTGSRRRTRPEFGPHQTDGVRRVGGDGRYGRLPVRRLAEPGGR